jgi:hypothetical protein
MILQKQPNIVSCLPTSVAMCLGIPVEDVFNFLGHEGTELLDPSVPAPFCFRGFHEREMVDVCYHYDHDFIKVDRQMQVWNGEGTPIHNISYPNQFANFWKYFEAGKSVITLNNPKPHAVAHYGGCKIYDPRGQIYHRTESINDLITGIMVIKSF